MIEPGGMGSIVESMVVVGGCRRDLRLEIAKSQHKARTEGLWVCPNLIAHKRKIIIVRSRASGMRRGACPFPD
jgi:hypothetical protein